MKGLCRLLLALFFASGCEVAPADWGLDAVRTLHTPADGELQCGLRVSTEATAAKRAACDFEAGAHAAESLGVSGKAARQIPIRHIIVLMKENRSFDHLFGKLHDQGQPDTEAIPSDYVNPDPHGKLISPSHATTTCIHFDPEHQATAMRAVIDHGAMDGFVKNAARSTGSDGAFAMSFYEQSDLPFNYWLANTYALSDRHFASMVGGTFGNRNFLMFGSNVGVVDTGISYPDPATPSIFRTLLNAGVTWGAYADAGPLSDTLGWSMDDPGVHSMQDLFRALDKGSLPNVAFVDGIGNVEDDHPKADLQVGEAWTRKVYEHVVNSPQWSRLAVLWTYDEGGAFADHVGPPSACRATPGSPFTDLGERVPLVVISPWAKRHFVSHTVHDHTAITRFIETVFDLPALTARDANSDALLDLFDFSCDRELTPPADAPDAGTGGCPEGPTKGG
jgi:phospholipase C